MFQKPAQKIKLQIYMSDKKTFATRIPIQKTPKKFNEGVAEEHDDDIFRLIDVIQ